MKRVPEHIAIIMDGNRRWAKRNLFSIPHGHSRGVEVMKSTVLACADMGVKVVTAYAFSTENWKRAKWEVNTLIELFHTFLREYKEEMIEKGIKFDTIGDLSPFPQSLIDLAGEVKEATKNSNRVELVLALNYGSRNEICRAVTRAIKSGIDPDQITEETFAKFLDTAKWPDPDLFIRTSGELRLSNYLLWQLSYAEIFVTKTFWPDFSNHDLKEAIEAYQKRQRRWGT